MNSIFVKILSGVVLCAAATFSVPSDAKSALAEASGANQYLFLTFYKAKDSYLSSMSTTIAAFKKMSPVKIALFDAAFDNPANKETADKYGVNANQLPLLLVVAPNGVVTGGYPTVVTTDQLKTSVSVSDLMLKVLKALQEQKVALVALQNGATKFNTESWAGVTDFANDTLYKKFVTAIKADPSAAGSVEFNKQCQLIAPITQATVVILLPPGKIGKILTGALTKNDVLKALGSCATGCAPGGCSDRRFKDNISPIVSALEKVTKLQGVTFSWNKKEYPRRFFTDDPQVGVIAQDVEAVVPEVVHTDKDGFKSVEYDKLTAVLIEAVKEMNKKIVLQDSLINLQNARIKALEAKYP